jgi:predicted MFS family arabinose efflux permease
MTEQQPTAAQEWRANWLLVLVSMAGITIGNLPSATLGLFMEPLQTEFGWSRTEISLGLSVFALVSLPLTPFVGMLVDRFGPRLVALPGIFASAAAFASFSLLGGSIVQWLFIWFLYTLAALLASPLVWCSAVSRAFSTSRGLALAIVLCGTALTVALAPTLTRWLIDGFGWRGGYMGLGIGWGGAVFVLAFLLFRDRRQPATSSSAASPQGDARLPGGLTVKEAVRSLRMNRIALATFLQTTMVMALMVHIVPLLVERGISRVEAVSIVTLLGFAAIGGKLVTGYLVDRVSGSILPMSIFLLPGVAYLLLLTGGDTVPVLSAAVILIGYSSGASLQITTYLTTRYAGMRNFATIFGMISSLMSLAFGIGPLLAGIAYDLAGNYTYLLAAGIPASLLAGLLVCRLGAYPEFAPVDPAPAVRPVEFPA